MQRTILVADDSVTIQKVVELTFMDEDYEVEAVGDGTTAIASLERGRPDLVIADVHMPGADGYEVCRQAKARYGDLPVLLLVGTFEPFDANAAASAGCDGHLKKPFDAQDLLLQVDRLIESSAPAAVQPAVPPASGSDAAATADLSALAKTADFSLTEIEPESAGEAPDVAATTAHEESAAPESAAFEFAAGLHEEVAAPPPPPVPAPSVFETSLHPMVFAPDEDEPEAAPAADSEAAGKVFETAFLSPEIAAKLAETGVAAVEDSVPAEELELGGDHAAPEPSAAHEASGGFELETMNEVELEAVRDAAYEATPQVAYEATPQVAYEATPPAVHEATSPVVHEATPQVAYEAAPQVELEAVVDEASHESGTVESAEAEPEPAASAAPTPALNSTLDDDAVERIARRVVELIGDSVLREVAWEVVPDLAEVVVKERLRELERQAE